MSQSTLAQLRNFSHAEIKALALAGLVFFQHTNSGRLIVCDQVDSDPGLNDSLIAQTIALLNIGDQIQHAIIGGDDAALPGLVQAFASIADSGVIDVTR